MKRNNIKWILIGLVTLVVLITVLVPVNEIKIEITYPSDENNILAPGGSFLVSGSILSDEPVPSGACLRVSLYKDNTEVRFAKSNQKDCNTIDRYNSEFIFNAMDVDPNRESLTAKDLPYLIVEDEKSPEDSIKNANIKCYFSDDCFSAFIPFATDEDHGLLFDDGIGFVDESGNYYEGLENGEYILKVVLYDSFGKTLSECSKTITIEPAKDSLLCRFSPVEHYYNMADFASANNYKIGSDPLPGYYTDITGNGNGGMRKMFIGADVANYATGLTHMFIYYADPKSTSLTVEVPYILKYRNVDDPLEFQAHCYDLGEASLMVNNEMIYGNIVTIDDYDKLYLSRADIAKDPTDGILDFADYLIYETDRDFTDGIKLSGTEGKLAIAGVVVPHQLKDEEIIFDLDNNKMSFTNYTEYLVYEFTSETDSKEYKKKVELTRYLNNENHSSYPSILEFYHVFDLNDFEKDSLYTVTVHGEDINQNIVEGTTEIFTIEF